MLFFYIHQTQVQLKLNNASHDSKNRTYGGKKMYQAEKDFIGCFIKLAQDMEDRKNDKI